MKNLNWEILTYKHGSSALRGPYLIIPFLSRFNCIPHIRGKPPKSVEANAVETEIYFVWRSPAKNYLNVISACSCGFIHHEFSFEKKNKKIKKLHSESFFFILNF